MFFYYKALRNLTFYLIWVAIGFIHLLIFYLLNQDPSIPLSIKDSIANLRITLPLILLYQVFRLLSLFVQSQELVGISSTSFKDIHNDRYVNIIDFILFFMYLMILAASTLKWSY